VPLSLQAGLKTHFTFSFLSGMIQDRCGTEAIKFCGKENGREWKENFEEEMSGKEA
jgi:hypothetical protein